MASRGPEYRSSILVLLLLGFLAGWSRHPVVVATATCLFSEEQREVSSIRTAGNATVVGIFNLHDQRRDCDPSQRSFGARPTNAAETQRMLAMSWALEWLNERDVLGGGLAVGFTGYSTCSDITVALRKTIYSLSQTGVLERCDENKTYDKLLGYVAPTDYSNSQAISGLLTSLNVSHEQLRLTSLEAEIKAIVSVLNRLKWDQVSLLAENFALQKQFFEISAPAGICVSQSFLMTRDVNYTAIYPRIIQSGSRVTVFLGFDYQLRKALDESKRYPEASEFYWLAAGPTVHDGFKLSSADDDSDRSRKIYFAQSSRSKVPGFEDYLRNFPENAQVDEDIKAFVDDCYKERSKRVQMEGGETTTTELPVGCSPILSNDVIAAAENVARLTERYRMAAGRNSCSSAETAQNETTGTSANDCQDELFQVPQLLGDQLNVSVMAYQLGPQNKTRFIEVGLYYNNQLIMKEEDMGILHDVGGGWFKVPRFLCPSCPCVNDPDRRHISTSDFWRVEPWVAACGTLATVGSLVAIIIAIFVIVRICRGDAMEGSQAFAFLLLTGVVLAYSSIIPFTLSPSPVVCNIRPIGIGLAYAFLFAPVLARCLMLATSDPDGLLGHVSGLVQTSLFFFMLAVQVALGVQQWWLVSGPEANPLSIRFDGVGCVVSTADYSMALSYVALLLFLLLILTPFCVRNRRNYHEGLFFFLATLASLAVWISWVAIFFKLDPEWKQPILCSGVVSTASVILILIFVPRVYKMVRAMTLDTVNAGLHSAGAAHCTVPSLTDMANRGSNAMIYETVNHAYAPEPILVNGDGAVVKSPSKPVNINLPADPPAVSIVVEDSGIVLTAQDTIEEEDPETIETTEKVDPEKEEDELENSSNGVAQRKPPTVTHL